MRHVVITGGASGIGEAVALRLVRSGHRVTILDRHGPESSPWWGSLAQENRGAWFSLDVTDSAAVDAAIQGSWAVAPIDGLVTSAGVVTRGSLLSQDAEAFSEGLVINIQGTVNPVRAVVRHMVHAHMPGSIVTLSSTAGLGYVSGLGASYHVAKSAIAGLTHSVAGDYAQHGIRINAVAPGVVRTPMSLSQVSDQSEKLLAARAPAGRLADPGEIADVIEWLLSPESRLTTGYIFPVDGGQSAVTGAPTEGYPAPERDTRKTGLLRLSTSGNGGLL
jgi:NAD(P)-dependent dehydrogenase (short-subunit alcohol dehydrogenase family)